MSGDDERIDLFKYGETVGKGLDTKMAIASGAAAIDDPGAFLSERAVAKRYSVHRSTIWRWVHSNPKFPKPVKLATSTSRWRLCDLLKFEASCPEVCRFDQRSSAKGQ